MQDVSDALPQFLQSRYEGFVEEEVDDDDVGGAALVQIQVKEVSGSCWDGEDAILFVCLFVCLFACLFVCFMFINLSID